MVNQQNTKEFLSTSLSEFIRSNNGKFPADISEYLKQEIAPHLKSYLSSAPHFNDSSVAERGSMHLVRLPCMLQHNSLEPEYFKLHEFACGLFGDGFLLDEKVSETSWLTMQRFQVSEIPALTTNSAHLKWNSSLSGANTKTIIVKSLIDLADSLDVNDTVEFFGFLENCCNDDEEDSSFPVFHCIHFSKLNPFDLLPSFPAVSEETFSRCNLKATHDALLQYLKGVCLGDALVAEMLLFHLSSKLRIRQQGLAESLKIGQWSFNLVLGPKFHTEFGVPSKWIESLASNLSQLVTRCSLLPLEIERLNEKPIYPVMDYERGFLNSKDSIQLSPGTHLIIDETRLSSGQLNEIGVRNVQSIMELIDHQTLPFMFSYQLSISMDVPIIVVSEGVSMFKMSASIPWRPKLEVGFEEALRLSSVSSGNESLIPFQQYLLHVQSLEPNWSEDASKDLENSFLAKRSENESFTAQDFSRILEIYRFKSLLLGVTDAFDEGIWKESCNLDEEWQTRLLSESSKSGIVSK